MTVVLQDRFRRELPEMAVECQADVPAEPELLVLNEALAGELGVATASVLYAVAVPLLLGDALPI